MKFLYPFAVLAGAAVVSAQSDAPDCDALHIVEACLESQNQRFESCGDADWDCKCRAAESIATCYNNCPNDPRAGDARGQVIIHCQNASVHGTAARTTATATPSAAADATDSAAATATPTSASDDDEDDGNSDDEEASQASASASASASAGADDDESGGVAQLALNTGGVLLAVAGAVAAIL